MSLERFALTGSPPLLPGLQVVASAFEGVTVRVLAWLLPSAALSHCPCPSPEPAALGLSVSVPPHRDCSLGGAPPYHDRTQNAQHRTWHTGGEAGPTARAAARAAWLPSVGSRATRGRPRWFGRSLWLGLRRTGGRVCVIPELVRKPGPARLVFSPAVSPQACDLLSQQRPFENWERPPAACWSVSQGVAGKECGIALSGEHRWP